MKIEKSKVVEVHLTMKDHEGVLIDTTMDDGEPLTYLHGSQDIVEGLEEALENLEVGSEFEVAVPPEKAYGLSDPKHIAEVPKEQFPDDVELEVGQQFMVETPEGPRTISIKEVKEEVAVIDGNHELAGMTIHYKGHIVSIREATDAELQHGTATSPCCSGGTCSAEE